VNLPWYEWTGLFGVLLVLLAYLLLQAHQLHGNGPVYQTMNALGALGVMVSLLVGSFNLPVFLLLLAWLVISVYGMLAGVRRRGRTRIQ
jgi:hypothetical protein